MVHRPSRPRKAFFHLFYFSLFVATAVFVVATTNGYVWNQHTLRFERTGLINLTVDQTPVEITLNGKKKIYKKSPVTLSYLMPGYYDVEVKKDSYATWNKSFYLAAGEVVVNPNVRLFLQDGQSTAAAADQINQLKNYQPEDYTDLDVRGTEIWAKQINRTYPFTSTDNYFTLVSRFVTPIVFADWLPERSNIVFQVDNEIRVMDRDGSNPHVLVELENVSPSRFMTLNNGRVLVYQDGAAFYQRRLYF